MAWVRVTRCPEGTDATSTACKNSTRGVPAGVNRASCTPRNGSPVELQCATTNLFWPARRLIELLRAVKREPRRAHRNPDQPRVNLTLVEAVAQCGRKDACRSTVPEIALVALLRARQSKETGRCQAQTPAVKTQCRASA